MNLFKQTLRPPPLSQLIQSRMREDDFKRVKRLGFLLEHFHLKHTVTELVSGRKIVINGREVINFGSANYLGYDQHPEVIKASQEALAKLGAHAGCSRIFSSHFNIVALEQEISALVGSQATMIGHNISQIHAGVIPALFSSENSVLYVDRFAHTSIFQACLIAKAKGAEIVRVDVADLKETQQKIQSTKKERNCLFVDGVYSMQGHIPPLVQLSEMAKDENVILYVDDAHGVGVYGENGGGVREEFNLSFENLLLVGSLQKAFGTYGGFICGEREVIEFLRSTSKAYIFSGTLQPSAVEGARKAVELCQTPEGRVLRQRLKTVSSHVRVELRQLGFDVPLGDSPIVPVGIGLDLTTLMTGRKMFDLGMYVNSVTFPAVPQGQGVLRISLTALHSDSDIAALLTAFAELNNYLKKHESQLKSFLHSGTEITLSKLLGKNYGGL